MNAVERRARKQAAKDADEFWENHDWEDILDRYAVTSNQADKELKKLERKESWGFTISEEDYEDYYYYIRYSELLALWMANTQLTHNGYKRDEDGLWTY